MPERGMHFAPKEHLLSYEELLRLVDIMGSLGVNKIRVTGGEPFVRSDLMYFLKELTKRKYLDAVTITSNLSLIRPYVSQLEALNLKDVNVSIDCLDREKFKEITHRDEFDEVYAVLNEMIERGFNLKLNCVVMRGVNEDQILPLLHLSQKHPVSVRFLEEMPFNGSGGKIDAPVSFSDILNVIRKNHVFKKMVDGPNSTSQNYSIEGFEGSFGVIPSFSRTFCGDCNRLRMSATGDIRTCLYGSSKLNVKEMLRSGATNQDIGNALKNAVSSKPKDGFEAEQENENELLSMTKLGG